MGGKRSKTEEVQILFANEKLSPAAIVFFSTPIFIASAWLCTIQ